MTGIPDAVVEAAWYSWAGENLDPDRPETWDIEAVWAEGPWRKHLATQIEDELREFLPEWDYPPHVVAAICLELKERLAR